jgi:hypothetical protein
MNDAFGGGFGMPHRLLYHRLDPPSRQIAPSIPRIGMEETKQKNPLRGERNRTVMRKEELVRVKTFPRIL